MTRKKLEPVVYHGNLMNHVDVNAMIRNQANMQSGTLEAPNVNSNNGPKVKKIDYKRINQPKK